MEKKDYFNKEYNYVKDTNKRNDLILLVSGLPDYFFEIPASSTGKYHPEFAATEHGLVKHTKVATRIAYELLNKSVDYNPRYIADEFFSNKNGNFDDPFFSAACGSC